MEVVGSSLRDCTPGGGEFPTFSTPASPRSASRWPAPGFPQTYTVLRKTGGSLCMQGGSIWGEEQLWN